MIGSWFSPVQICSAFMQALKPRPWKRSGPHLSSTSQLWRGSFLLVHVTDSRPARRSSSCTVPAKRLVLFLVWNHRKNTVSGFLEGCRTLRRAEAGLREVHPDRCQHRISVALGSGCCALAGCRQGRQVDDCACGASQQELVSDCVCKEGAVACEFLWSFAFQGKQM